MADNVDLRAAGRRAPEAGVAVALALLHDLEPSAPAGGRLSSPSWG